MSIRVFTDEQFSDGTTIDGNRLESTMQSLEARVNTVPNGDLKNRWTQTQFVLGFPPPLYAGLSGATYNKGQRPWMNKVNTVDLAVVGDVGTVQNEYRLKGNDDGFYQWTTSILLVRPAIIDAYDLVMAHDTVVSYPYAPGDSSNQTNIGIQLTVDNPWRPEDRTQNDMVLHKKEFGSNAWQANSGTGAPTADMVPSYAGSDRLEAIAVSGRDLNIPLAANTRLRFAITIPFNGTTYWGKSGASPAAPYRSWLAFAPSVTLTLLEPLIDA